MPIRATYFPYNVSITLKYVLLMLERARDKVEVMEERLLFLVAVTLTAITTVYCISEAANVESFELQLGEFYILHNIIAE